MSVEAAIEADSRIAYTLRESARLCSIGYSTIRMHVKAGKVTPGR